MCALCAYVQHALHALGMLQTDTCTRACRFELPLSLLPTLEDHALTSMQDLVLNAECIYVCVCVCVYVYISQDSKQDLVLNRERGWGGSASAREGD